MGISTKLVFLLPREAHGPAYFYCMVTGAATIGCLLNYSMFLCTMYTSALTTTIVGVLRGVATVLLGFALDTVPYSFVNVVGITLNTCGGVWYTWIKYTDKVAGSSKAGPRSGRSGSYAQLPSKDSDAVDVVITRPSDGGSSATKLSSRGYV